MYDLPPSRSPSSVQFPPRRPLIVAAFISGVNYADGRSLEVDVEWLAAWVADYCTRRPDERFLDALLELDAELDARQTAVEQPAGDPPPAPVPAVK
jgi:hypothetical protein